MQCSPHHQRPMVDSLVLHSIVSPRRDSVSCTHRSYEVSFGRWSPEPSPALPSRRDVRHHEPGLAGMRRRSASIVVADVLWYSSSRRCFQGRCPYKNSGKFIDVSKHAMQEREDELSSQLELSPPGHKAGWERLPEVRCNGCVIDEPA